MNPREIGARLLNLVKLGRVVAVSDDQSTQNVQVRLPSVGPDGPPLTWLPRLAEYGFTSSPPAGSDAAIVSLWGERGQGVVVATGHQPSRPTGLTAGDALLYSAREQKVWLADDGLHVDGGGGAVTVGNFTSCTVQGDLTVTGSIQAGADVVANSQTAPVSLATHQHGLTTDADTTTPLPS